MNLRLIILEQTDYIEYKNDMQEAFRLGAADVFGMEEDVLPEEDIQKSLKMDNCRAYKAVIDEKMVGGAIIEINEQTHHNHLHFLYVKHGFQSRGMGNRNTIFRKEKYSFLCESLWISYRRFPQ